MIVSLFMCSIDGQQLSYQDEYIRNSLLFNKLGIGAFAMPHLSLL